MGTLIPNSVNALNQYILSFVVVDICSSVQDKVVLNSGEAQLYTWQNPVEKRILHWSVGNIGHGTCTLLSVSHICIRFLQS